MPEAKRKSMEKVIAFLERSFCFLTPSDKSKLHNISEIPSYQGDSPDDSITAGYEHIRMPLSWKP